MSTVGVEGGARSRARVMKFEKVQGGGEARPPSVTVQ